MRVELGGVAWERSVVDPRPGPRRIEELAGVEQLGSLRAALCSPEGRTREGARLAEAGVAAHLGRPTVLVDVTKGPAGAATGIAAAAERLACERVILADVGGDVLAGGHEPGLASPLCDAVMLASVRHLPDRLDAVGCVVGAGCDGELTPPEVLDRVALLARDGAWLATSSITADTARELLAVAELVPTEASLQAARCALGATGRAMIRGGRRTVELGPAGALAILFDPAVAMQRAAPLAALVADAGSIEAARGRLAAAGVRTELDFEQERAAAGAPLPGA